MNIYHLHIGDWRCETTSRAWAAHVARTGQLDARKQTPRRGRRVVVVADGAGWEYGDGGWQRTMDVTARGCRR